MMDQSNGRHSRPAVQRLADAADGRGGAVLVVTAEGPPHYAGLHRGGADTLLEATLTLLNPNQYEEVLLVTGEGDHLPDLQITSHDSCGRQRLIWLLERTSGAPDASAATSSDDDLLDFAKLKSTDLETHEILVHAHRSTWPERMTDMITHIGVRLKASGSRSLIVIDDQFLQPRPQHDQANHVDRPGSGKGVEIERKFKELPALCRNSSADLVLLCRNRLMAPVIVDAESKGPIHREMLSTAGDSDYAQETAQREAASFPKLFWPGVAIVELETMDPTEANAGALPGSDPKLPLYDILRKCAPAPKEDPLDALDSFVGMDEVRRKLEELGHLLVQQEDLRRLGRTPESMGLHVALYGYPGTGKSEVAKAIAHIYKKMGVLPGKFVQCDGRADLVGKYVGHTAPKLKEKCEEARNGVLFIDEAYLLAQGGENDFGKEVIGELLGYMTSKKIQLAVIAAGYPGRMREFLAANEGLQRRFKFHINMPEYDDDQLVEVLVLHAQRSGLSVPETARTLIRSKIAAHRKGCAAQNLSFGFAGDAVNLLEKTRLAQSSRLARRPRGSVSLQDYDTLTLEDFQVAKLDLPGGGLEQPA